MFLKTCLPWFFGNPNDRIMEELIKLLYHNTALCFPLLFFTWLWSLNPTASFLCKSSFCLVDLSSSSLKCFSVCLSLSKVLYLNVKTFLWTMEFDIISTNGLYTDVCVYVPMLHKAHSLDVYVVFLEFKDKLLSFLLSWN